MERGFSMVLRALLAFVALPGVVAFAIPLVWLAAQGEFRPRFPLGLIVLATGVIGLVACVREFLVTGQGTLAPWDPPRKLVQTGLFRYSRNPMYVSVALILIGWAASYLSWPLLVYSVVVVVVFHLRVVLGEEPWLARRYGDEWREYSQWVPRWFLW
jgi:protein-S-isoprenylcysteine O-methyltransferase Ste14